MLFELSYIYIEVAKLQSGLNGLGISVWTDSLKHRLAVLIFTPKTGVAPWRYSSMDPGMSDILIGDMLILGIICYGRYQGDISCILDIYKVAVLLYAVPSTSHFHETHFSLCCD